MEQLVALKRNRTALGVVCFLVTTVVLTLIDMFCVGAYFGALVCLLYFTFLKDCFEIFIYAVVKFIARLKWLYGVFKIREFLYVSTVTNGLESSISRSLQDSVSEQSLSCTVRNSPDTEATSTYNTTRSSLPFNSNQSNFLDLAASSSFKSTYNPLLFISSQSNSLQSETEVENRSSELLQTPLSSKSQSEEPVPRKLSSLSTHVISSTDNIDESNFEDVDLSDETIKNDGGTITPKEESNFRQSSSKWDMSTMKIFYSFRKNKLTSSANIKSQLGNIAAKVWPQRADDKEKLVNDKNDSPEQIGCCSSLPHIFKSKHQISSVAPYESF